MPKQQVVVGILALQGAFAEHKNHLQKAVNIAKHGSPLASVDVIIQEIRTPEQLALSDALVFPGGESTSISLIAESTGILEPLRRYVRVEKKPVWGTCAGLILLSDEASKAKRGGQELVGGLHVRCQRNHFGRQTESFEKEIKLPFINEELEDPFKAVFIRAPIVEKLLTLQDRQVDVESETERLVKAPIFDYDSNDTTPVEIVATLDGPGSDIVAVRQGNIFGTSFHPELTPDVRLHAWWLTEFVVKPSTD
ncbi:class I glutamine amidotransferase-like protein [Lipomyces japonicus]|uniref:class I glutamine amidotransferase-like protein n=1 Tax=Lipomyces japonicus TaxID=56871 RepID=UPI0034CD385A